MDSTKLTAQQRKRLDRQRFIGLQTQKKLLNSRILITPANGPNTQLAKNLVLAGVNVTIYDNDTVTTDDFETNFLVGLDQVGQKRGQVIFNRLKQMNPTGKNQFFCEKINLKQVNQQFLDKFTIICTSFTDFGTILKWDELTKKTNKPYYNITSAGIYSFCYVSLGDTYTFKDPVTKKDAKQYTVRCLTLDQCFDKGEVQKSRKKQIDMLQAIIMMKESQQKGLSYDPFDQMKMYEQMLYCMIDLAEEIKQNNFNRELMINFAKSYGIQYCPVYSVIGSIVSQQIIKVVQNQQQPAMNWIVMNSQDGYACVLKLKKQEERIQSKLIYIKSQ